MYYVHVCLLNRPLAFFLQQRYKKSFKAFSLLILYKVCFIDISAATKTHTVQLHWKILHENGGRHHRSFRGPECFRENDLTFLDLNSGISSLTMGSCPVAETAAVLVFSPAAAAAAAAPKAAAAMRKARARPVSVGDEVAMVGSRDEGASQTTRPAPHSMSSYYGGQRNTLVLQ